MCTCPAQLQDNSNKGPECWHSSWSCCCQTHYTLQYSSFFVTVELASDDALCTHRKLGNHALSLHIKDGGIWHVGMACMARKSLIHTSCMRHNSFALQSAQLRSAHPTPSLCTFEFTYPACQVFVILHRATDAIVVDETLGTACFAVTLNVNLCAQCQGAH
jgi:hypothetical protein